MWKAKSFGVTLEFVASTIGTSSKLVFGDLGFVNNSIMLLHGMKKDESLSTTIYAFVM